MQYLRTPDDRFADLPGYTFLPNYVSVPDGEDGELRVHYIDEGPRSADPVLMLHGEPSWAYLYRKMIPIIRAAGHRVIAPDLVGFGRSDKPARRDDYTYQRHVDWMHSFINELDLRNMTLVCQDWGGLIGLRLAAEQPDRFSSIVAANTFLPTGDQPPGEAFMRWQRFSQETPNFNVGRIVNGGCITDLPSQSSPRMMRRFRTRPIKRARGSSRFSCLLRRKTRPRQRTGVLGKRCANGRSPSSRPLATLIP